MIGPNAGRHFYYGYYDGTRVLPKKPQAERACGFFFGEPNRRFENTLRCGRHILEEKNHENL